MTLHLDYDSKAFEAASAPQHKHWVGLLSRVLSLCFFLYVFVGLHPLTVSTPLMRTNGSIADRLATSSLTAVALLIILTNWRTSMATLRGNALAVMIIAFCLLSTLWSDYPDLTLRRALLTVMLGVVAMASAVGLTSLRAFHTLLFVTLAGIIVMNLACVALWPSFAISEFGVTGIYGQKNVAGMVALITLIVCVTWTVGSSQPSQWLLGLLASVATASFLVMTASKTSIGIALVALALGGMFWIASVLGHRFVLLMITALLFGCAGFIGLLVIVDFDMPGILTLFLTDTSFTGRDELWAFVWQKASERLWLGHGYAAFWDVGEFNDPLNRLEPGTWLGDVPKGVINQAHSGYLELWLQIGLPATIAAVVAVVIAMVTATRLAVTSTPESQTRSTFAAIALTLFMYLLHNVTEATLFMRGNQFFVLVLMMMFIVSRFAAARRDADEPSGRLVGSTSA